MNLRLTPAQIDDIFDAAEHVDVPVEQLLDAAAEIRAALLGAGGELVLPVTPLVVDEPRVAAHPTAARVDAMRRARVMRTALVAAALALATLLSAAVAGALPAPLQSPIAQMAKLLGIDLPEPDSAAPTVESSGGTQGSATNAPNTGRASSSAAGTTDTNATTPAAAETAPADQGLHGPPDNPGNAFAYGQDPTHEGNAYGLDPTHEGTGPPADPGQGNGNGPPDDPGNGNGNGPPAPPGTGNGNNPDGPGA